MQIYDAMSRLIDFIEDNLTNSIKIDDVSKDINYSISRLEIIFCSITGLTIKQYITKRRLSEIAKGLLLGKPIPELAAEYCYSSHANLNRAFVKEYGVTTGQYKKCAPDVNLLNKFDISEYKKCAEEISARLDDLVEKGFFNSKKSYMHDQKCVLEVNVIGLLRFLSSLHPYAMPKRLFDGMLGGKDRDQLMMLLLTIDYYLYDNDIEKENLKIRIPEDRLLQDFNTIDTFYDTENSLYLGGHMTYFLPRKDITDFVNQLAKMFDSENEVEPVQYRTIWKRENETYDLQMPLEVIYAIRGDSKYITKIQANILYYILRAEQGKYEIKNYTDLYSLLKSGPENKNADCPEPQDLPIEIIKDELNELVYKHIIFPYR